MPLPHRLIIDGVEECASDDKKEFLRMAVQYLSDLEQVDKGKHGYPDPVTDGYIAYVMERT